MNDENWVRSDGKKKKKKHNNQTALSISQTCQVIA